MHRAGRGAGARGRPSRTPPARSTRDGSPSWRPATPACTAPRGRGARRRLAARPLSRPPRQERSCGWPASARRAGRARSSAATRSGCCTRRWPPPSCAPPGSTSASRAPIELHTVGGAGMDALAKCLYLADFCEPGARLRRPRRGPATGRALAGRGGRRGGAPDAARRDRARARRAPRRPRPLQRALWRALRATGPVASARRRERKVQRWQIVFLVVARRRSWPSPPSSAPCRLADCILGEPEKQRKDGYLALITFGEGEEDGQPSAVLALSRRDDGSTTLYTVPRDPAARRARRRVRARRRHAVRLATRGRPRAPARAREIDFTYRLCATATSRSSPRATRSG